MAFERRTGKRARKGSGRERTLRHGRFLALASVVLFLYGVVGIVVALFLGGLAFASATIPEVADLYNANALEGDGVVVGLGFLASLSFIEAILQLVSAVMGFRVARGRGRAHNCEIMAVVLVGMATLGTLTNGFVFEFQPGTLIDWGLSVAIPVLYGIAARVEARSDFWQRLEADRRSSVREYLVSSVPPCTVSVRGACVEGTLYVPVLALPGWARHKVASGSREAPRFEGEGDDGLESAGEGARHFTVSFACVQGGVWVETDDMYLLSLMKVQVRNACDTSCDPSCGEARVPATPAVMVALLAGLAKDGMGVVGQWRDRLHLLEGVANGNVSDVPEDFDEHVTQAREALYILARFYRQLEDVCQVLDDDAPWDGDAKDSLQSLSERLVRLSGEAREAAELALQVRSLYQSRLEVRQAEVAQVLTIVATVCMSVSVVTSWYGMNFDNMPELHNQYSYLLVIFICVVAVTAELVYFKRKKWF